MHAYALANKQIVHPVHTKTQEDFADNIYDYITAIPYDNLQSNTKIYDSINLFFNDHVISSELIHYVRSFHELSVQVDLYPYVHSNSSSG